MVLEFIGRLLRKRYYKGEKPRPRRPRLRRPRRQKTVFINPLEAQRLVIDGKEYLVREVLSVGPHEIVVRDIDGTIKNIKRVPQEPEPQPQGPQPHTERRQEGIV